MKKLTHGQIKTILGEGRICQPWDDFKDSEGYVDLLFFREYVNLSVQDCKTRLCKNLNLDLNDVSIHSVAWNNVVMFEADVSDSDWDKAMAYIKQVEDASLDDLLVTTTAFLKLMTRYVETKGKYCSEQEVWELKNRTHALYFSLSGGTSFSGDLVELLETSSSKGCRAWYDEEANEFVLVSNRSVDSMTYADIVTMTKSSIPLAQKTIKAIIDRINALRG